MLPLMLLLLLLLLLILLCVFPAALRSPVRRDVLPTPYPRPRRGNGCAPSRHAQRRPWPRPTAHEARAFGGGFFLGGARLGGRGHRGGGRRPGEVVLRVSALVTVAICRAYPAERPPLARASVGGRFSQDCRAWT